MRAENNGVGHYEMHEVYGFQFCNTILFNLHKLNSNHTLVGGSSGVRIGSGIADMHLACCAAIRDTVLHVLRRLAILAS